MEPDARPPADRDVHSPDDMLRVLTDRDSATIRNTY